MVKTAKEDPQDEENGQGPISTVNFDSLVTSLTKNFYRHSILTTKIKFHTLVIRPMDPIHFLKESVMKLWPELINGSVIRILMDIQQQL